MYAEIDKKEIGDRITKLIGETDMTLTEFAMMADITYRGLWSILSGRTAPNAKTLIGMSQVLGVTTDYILGLSEER